MNTSYKIDRATPADSATILSLQKLAYQTEAALYQDWAIPPLHQTIEELSAEFREKTILKAYNNENIVGSVRIMEAGDTCCIGRLIVHPDHQRKGIGSSLLSAVEALFPSVSRFELFTGDRSLANIRLYERMGFKAFRQEQLSPQVTLVFMQKLREQKVPKRPSSVIRYAHTSLTANNWRRLMDFYCKVFGCEPVSSERYNKGPKFEALTGVINGSVRGQHLRLPGYGDNSPTLELFQYEPGESPLPPSIKRPGFAHLAFEVPDVEATRNEILNWGGRDYGKLVTLEIPGAGTLTLIYMCDPEGNIIELQRWH